MISSAHSSDYTLCTTVQSSWHPGIHPKIQLSTSKVSFEQGKGAWLGDVDGNNPIDYLLVHALMLLGHTPDDINQADADAVSVGTGKAVRAQHSPEVEAGERVLRRLGRAKKSRFGVSGTESVRGALRLARAATGKKKFLRIEGRFHHWFDNGLVAVKILRRAWRTKARWRAISATQSCKGGTTSTSTKLLSQNPRAISRRLVRNRTRSTLNRSRLNSAVSNASANCATSVTSCSSSMRPSRACGSVPKARRGSSGSRPNLATFGKAIAGGWKVSATAGRADPAALFGTGVVNHSGTFNSSVMSAAAVSATMNGLAMSPPCKNVREHGAP